MYRESKRGEILGNCSPPLTELNVTLVEFMLRRIAIPPSKRHVSLKGEHLKLRSLLLFQNAELIKLHISECKNFKFLRVLNLVRRDVDKWHVSSEIDLELLPQCHHLSKLELRGEIKEDLCPSHHVSKFLPPNIVKLALCSSKMIHDPMGVLKNLPCLRILRLRDNAYVGTKMICSIHGFPQLDSLEMISLRELKEWEIEKCAMSRLRSLHLNDIYNLKMIPERLRYIITLQELKLTDMRRSLEEKIQVKNETKGEDFYKVRHIPSIQIR
ncbi:probable disease resistance RPP8-like protein 2 [Gossypium hirsutum]|uniref:Probable disease resistance RPP8-like protein 2 n=1 Tax=Gossypium hirsutum TaxID=3635 RepID=A0ABM2YVP3_GOSHI|nr:probable disease resistance RPP8-like protein 2 [Gossypium hirsutum]